MRLSILLFVAISVGAARPASAQSITLLPCWRPMIGIGIGPAVNGDRNGDGSPYEFDGKGATRDLSASIDVPAGGEWAARIEAGRGAWVFEEHDYLGGTLLLRDRVRVKRLTAGAMKSFGRPCDLPLRLFAGFGMGAYRYEYSQGRAVTRAGAHVFAGMDFLLGERAAISIAASMHFIDGPGLKPVFSNLFSTGGLSVGMKFGF